VDGTATRIDKIVVVVPAGVVMLWILHFVTREALPAGDAGRLAVTVALLASLVALVWLQARLIRSKDEFTRSVHLSALAIAFPLSLLAVFAFGLLDGEGLLDWFDTRDLPAVMLVSYVAGITLARRRYQ
jgi:hypothetical protein